MNLNEKKFQQILPGTGTGVNVLDGDIILAIRQFKKNVKDSEKLKYLFSKRHHVKKSDKRRKELDNAKFIQKKISDQNREYLNW